jgi:uncharacterized protein YjdB
MYWSNNTTKGSGTPAASNAWVSATPAVASVNSTGLVTGLIAGTSVITYTNNNGCSITATVTVNPLPTITGILSVCVGATTQLTGSGSPAASNAWVSGTPAVATVNSTGLVTGLAAGTSVITYTNNNGCSITATVTVNARPTITGTLSVCVGSATQLTGSGTPAASNPWVSATPAVATVNSTGLVTGIAAGTSVITYTNSIGCQQTTTITVNANPTGGSISPAVSPGCTGANSGTLTLSGYTGSVIRWESSINGGATWTPISSNTTTTQTYSNLTQTTIYRAVLQSNGCISYSSVAVVSIIPQQAVTATANPTTICAGQSSVLTGSGGIPVPTGGIPDGDFNQGNPDGWCVDGNCSGSFFAGEWKYYRPGPLERNQRPYIFWNIS